MDHLLQLCFPLGSLIIRITIETLSSYIQQPIIYFWLYALPIEFYALFLSNPLEEYTLRAQEDRRLQTDQYSSYVQRECHQVSCIYSLVEA